MISKNFVMGFLYIVLSSFAAATYAHKVNLFAYVEGDQIYVQGYFSDGHKAKNSEVTVYGGEGDQKELLKGQTNEEGDFTFPVPGKQSLRIVLNAGLGHQATYLMSVEEVIGAVSQPLSNPDSLAAKQSSSPNDTNIENVDTNSISESMLRKAVAQGVLPLAREISELKERRGFSDIVGGIGLIVGLLGIFAYMKARQALQKVKELKSTKEG